MISKKMFRILNGLNDLTKKGISIKMDIKDYSKYKVLDLLNWSGEYDDAQYPFADNLIYENPDLIEYITFDVNSECVFLNEKAHVDIAEYRRGQRIELREYGLIIISVIALIVSVVAIYVSIAM